MLNEDIRDRSGDSLCQRDGVILVPYAPTGEGPSIPDDALRKVWGHVVRDRIDLTVWDDSVRTEHQFLNFVKEPNNLHVFIYSDSWQPLGAAWLNGVQKNYGFGHFFFLREAWGRKTLSAGQMVLDYWFSFPGEGGGLFDVIIGNIPEKNRKAISYIHKLGFKELGTIPHIADGGAMSVNYIERKNGQT